MRLPLGVAPHPHPTEQALSRNDKMRVLCKILGTGDDAAGTPADVTWPLRKRNDTFWKVHVSPVLVSKKVLDYLHIGDVVSDYVWCIPRREGKMREEFSESLSFCFCDIIDFFVIFLPLEKAASHTHTFIIVPI